MREVTKFIDRETREVFSFGQIEEKAKDFKNYAEFEVWREQHYEERTCLVESPYEYARSRAYATGNRWAMENFNATHN